MSAPTAAVPAGVSTLSRVGAPARPLAASIDPARASVAARVAPPARAPGGSRRVAAAAGKDQRNPTVGAISDANATRSDARVSWDGVFSTKNLAEVDDASPEDDAVDAVEAEAAPLAPAAGFWVRAKAHDAGCSCAVCVQLRDLIANAPEPLAVPISGEEADPIFIAHDGGFIVGKHQQKHHIGGCKCPNCNHQNFRRDNSTAKCVHVPPELLSELVGPENMHQKVMDKQAELDRRAKIGAANKGKSAWNKGRSHSPETIAKIKANTAKAMQNPEVKRRMREAASKTQHSESTKRKIRRTVRDSAHKKMVARNEEKSAKMGIRRGKVGQVSIGTFARRVSAVQTVRFGVWSKMDMEAHEERKKQEAREQKRLEREAKKRKEREEKLAAKAKNETEAKSTRGVPKSAAHRKAISDALKAKWEDPDYIKLQKKANRTRKRPTASSSARDDAARNRAVSEAEKKRERLVAEMKEIYTKASVAVRALEERKSAGLDVDEVMLQKALSAVTETRKVLESLGQVPDTGARRTKKKPAKREAPSEGPRVVHMVDGKVVEPEPEGGEGEGDDGIDRV